MPNSPNNRRWAFDAAIAALVLAIELFATWDSINADPFSPVDDWGATNSTDLTAFIAVTLGCVALLWRRRYPITVLAVTVASLGIYLLRDYELGLFLPVMVAIYTVVSLGQSRIWTAIGALASLVVSLWWVHLRTEPIADDGVALLAWVAFGTVFAVFYFGPFALGEVVGNHRLLREIAIENPAETTPAAPDSKTHRRDVSKQLDCIRIPQRSRYVAP